MPDLERVRRPRIRWHLDLDATQEDVMVAVLIPLWAYVLAQLLDLI